MEDGFDPDTALAGSEALEVTRDQLLARVVLVHAGHEMTVKDLIPQAANVGGAVHLGAPRTETERALSELGAQLQIGGYTAGTRALQAIARVVLKGLSPLAERVKSDRAVS